MRDEPLFTTDIEKSEGPSSERLSIEEYNTRQENRRKNKILDFGFSAMLWVLGFAILLIIADLIAQAFQLDSSLIEKCFTLIQYIVTAVLGFIFGRKTNE